MVEIRKGARCLIWVAVSSKPQANEDERVSLAQQEADARAVAARFDGVIIDVLRVPGFSRDYYNTVEWIEDMRKRGLSEPAKLMEYIERRAFDVFLCRDADRFGRKSSLVQEIAGKITDTGAVIFPLATGRPIDKREVLMWGTLTGYKAEEDNRKLIEYRHAGLSRRVERGLNINHVQLSHRVERDDSGKPLRLVVNEETQPFILFVAERVAQGVAWRFIEKMAAEAGFVNPKTGKPWTSTTIYRMFFVPIFWGNSAYGIHKHEEGYKGAWVYDPNEPPPPHVRKVAYNTHEPALPPELAARVQSELRRRHSTIHGKSRGVATKPFSGLLVCGSCWMKMVYSKKRENSEYYVCQSRHRQNNRRDCYERGIRLRTVRDYITANILKPIYENVDISAVLSGSDEKDSLSRRVSELEKMFASKQSELDEAVRLQIQARTTRLADTYQRQVERLSDELETVEGQLKEVRRRLIEMDVTADQRFASDELRQMGIEGFWERDNTTINQHLHRLMGRYRLVIRDKKVDSIY
jgi:hypothetical protein